MKYLALTMFAVAVSLMMGCVGMTCPMSKTANSSKSIEYEYVNRCTLFNNIGSNNPSYDLQFALEHNNISAKDGEVVSVSVTPVINKDKDTEYLMTVTYKIPNNKKISK